MCDCGYGWLVPPSDAWSCGSDETAFDLITHNSSFVSIPPQLFSDIILLLHVLLSLELIE